MFPTVAILGAAGPTGQALATHIAGHSCSLRLFDLDEAGAEQLAQQLKHAAPHADVEALGCPATASWEADLIVLALPLAGQVDAARQIAPYVTQKTVCSVGNATTSDLSAVLPVLAELRLVLPHSIIRTLSITPVGMGCETLLRPSDILTLEQLLEQPTS
ncbi:hypothetical protein [Hymenobacter lucidus]|uniref:Pyrroline-5-carboxylate reductase catalytic N-terminal domain-containing protein n=1 Tax=Hymenobacter lucidus TaxID=2880930 RepID=A0ABS8AYZ9_9BACT|nr:hypothetical protein [Hymenobacter lucidus]MCB2411034.1 hypothetical protein [Hymenobacter lucidus]